MFISADRSKLTGYSYKYKVNLFKVHQENTYLLY